MTKQEHDRKYYLKHREKIRAMAWAKRTANPEPSRRRAAMWAKENPDRVRAQASLRYLKNKETVKKYAKQYIKDHPEKRSASRAARRAKTRLAILDKNERAQIHALYRLRNELTCSTGIPHHVDHIVPLSKGGEHRISNLQILTASDNMRKHTRLALAQERLA